PVKTNGSEIRLGVSVDQFAAAHIGHDTHFPSLELGTEKGRQSGNCDSGYSCAYSNNISWRNEFTPMAKETNPRQVFERLFGNDQSSEMKASQVKRKLYRKSILDFVMEDARLLNKQIGGSDRMKMDEYLTAVREIELRIQATESTDQEHQSALIAGAEKPEGIPDNYRDHIRIMADMMVLAFQTDMTRIASCMFANAGSNKSYRAIGVPDGHHSLSHHQNNPIKLEKIRKINQFHVEQLAYLLERLKSIREGDSNLLDNCMILYGSGINDGNRHNNEDLPIILAGRGGGTLLPGRHVRYANETPLTNLFLSLLNRMNVETDYFGDSTGHLPFLNG
ncbi:MAG TPA: DUF1552 domain-containing protein, partial [Verrucomicrobia bacterium]|nr:DUF1552 domain-containing protein [Verrucomicrobiota bacterium]